MIRSTQDFQLRKIMSEIRVGDIVDSSLLLYMKPFIQWLHNKSHKRFIEKYSRTSIFFCPMLPTWARCLCLKKTRYLAHFWNSPGKESREQQPASLTIEKLKYISSRQYSQAWMWWGHILFEKEDCLEISWKCICYLTGWPSLPVDTWWGARCIWDLCHSATMGLRQTEVPVTCSHCDCFPQQYRYHLPQHLSISDNVSTVSLPPPWWSWPPFCVTSPSDWAVHWHWSPCYILFPVPVWWWDEELY